jgi:F-type H+-transporting ATPase subunit delta
MSFPIQVASRYAKSLLNLAQEKNLVEEFKSDLATYIEVFRGNYDFNLMMHSPIIKKSKKITVVKLIFEGKISETMLSFFLLVIKKGREGGLDEISNEFLRQYDLYKGIQKAEVVSSSALSTAARTQIEQLVAEKSGKKVELTETIDASLIGGFVLRIDDVQIDSSIKSQLRKIKDSIS